MNLHHFLIREENAFEGSVVVVGLSPTNLCMLPQAIVKLLQLQLDLLSVPHSFPI